MQARAVFLLAFIPVILCGCNSFKSWVASEFMADKVSDGVARLSAQHMSVIVSELNPRFDQAEVSISPATEAEHFGKGTVTWTLRDAVIDHPHEVAVHSDCHGEEGLWRGKIRIKKATKRMFGRLTDNPDKPVIPEPGSLKIKVEADVDDLAIRFPKKEGYLKLKEGSLSFVARPRLAQNDSGMRLSPTPNTRFEKVRLNKLSGVLVKNSVRIPVRIDEGYLTVQVGEGEHGQENHLQGSIILSGFSYQVPTDGAGLDPDYDRQKFISSYACRQSTPGTVSYEHVPIENKMAPGVAGLSSALMAAIATELEENTVCGMNSVGVLKGSRLSGEPGAVGELNTVISQECVLHFSHQQSQPNCFGQAKIINGTVRVLKASKTVNGLVVASQQDFKNSIKDYSAALKKSPLEGLAKRPKAIIPISSQPVTVKFTVKLEDISFTDTCTNAGNISDEHHCYNKPTKAEDILVFNVKAAEIDMLIKPVAAKSLDDKSPTQYLCATKTPLGEASLTIKNMQAFIDRAGLKLKVLAHGAIAVVRGRIGNKENQLSGALHLGDQRFEFKSADHDFISLDPTYKRDLFLRSFMSCQQLALTNDDEECRPEPALAANMARLLVLNAGSLLKVAASSAVPQSFASSYAVLKSEVHKEGTILKMPAQLTASLDLADPAYNSLAHSEDGIGTKTSLQGHILSLSATMIRQGELIHKPINVLGININILSNRFLEGASAMLGNKKEVIMRPLDPASTTIELKAHVKDFATIRYRQEQKAEASISMRDALIDLKATPYFAIDARTKAEKHPSYSIATPVVNFEHIKIHAARAVFTGAHITIPFYCQQADLKAYNGRIAGEGNYLEGHMRFRLMSETAAMAIDEGTDDEEPAIIIERQALVPDYDQQSFDKSYAHTEYLHAVLR